MSMSNTILSFLYNAKKENHKLLAILLDPDKIAFEDIKNKILLIDKKKVDLLLVGGSLLFTNILDSFIKEIKKHTQIPVVIFPGSALQISNEADAILFLSLLSGRNPDFLIGNQVIAAPLLKQTHLEILSTSYLLIESGRETTASYISNTKPIPRHKPEIAMATAMAGEMMGHQLTYLDGGSGALEVIPSNLIKMLANNCNLPIIVGGGIHTKLQLKEVYNAGATMAVIGNAFEENDLLLDTL
jgi:putative glycerol-1-phosphate prenyltransferase